jgi:transcriptional regulator with XRE-family HTH domain
MPDDVAIGRQVQAVRLARNLRQQDVAARAGVSRPTVSRLERGELDGLTLGTIRAISRALGMPSVAHLGWRGPEVEQLLDRVHAAMVECVASRLRHLGWEVVPEFSFNHYGERGSVDIIAWRPTVRSLLVVEAKSHLWDLQSTLMTLDRKRRLVPALAAEERGWRADHAGSVLVMPETRAHRRAIERHESTFRAALPDRQIRVKEWLEEPAGDLRGIWFLNIDRQAVTRQRARRKRARPRAVQARAARPRREEPPMAPPMKPESATHRPGRDTQSAPAAADLELRSPRGH